MGESQVTEPWARSIMEAAIREDRCAEVLNCLFDGGSVTIDAATGRIALATADQLASLWERWSDDDE